MSGPVTLTSHPSAIVHNPVAKRSRGPLVTLLAGVEAAVLNVMIGLVVAVVGGRLRKRLRGRQ
jgi:hypothetical protein